MTIRLLILLLAIIAGCGGGGEVGPPEELEPLCCNSLRTEMTTPTQTESQVRGFLAQFKLVKRSMNAWPKWMRDAAVTRAAAFPKKKD